MKPGPSSERGVQLEEFQRKHRTGLVTLLFTDMVESTALKHQLGDRPSATLFQQHHRLVRETLAQFPEGEEVETAGDSFWVIFATPSDAVQFALLLQARLRKLKEQSHHAAVDRIGIHVGEVVMGATEQTRKPRDLYGIQIDACARVMGLASAGQVLLTRSVFDSARQVLKGEDIEEVGPLEWLNHGPYLLKGLEEPLEICEVREIGQQTSAPPTSSDKAQRRLNAEDEPVLGWRPAIGQRVPNTQWTLEKKLGEGGFGEVWLGRHQVMKERRVFKFCFKAERVRFLKREMTLFRLLKERVGDHPNIVSLREVYFNEPPFYVEMDYVEGSDLRTWCEERGRDGMLPSQTSGTAARDSTEAERGWADRIPLETRLEIVAQAAEGLQAAHDAGVIHRDIKPTNILVQSSSRGHEAHSSKSETRNPKSKIDSEPPHVGCYEVRAKLTDFGIGQVVSEEALAGITRAGFTQTMMADSSSSHTGTQLYMAPELLAGKPASIRSDIYTLGVVLYQLLVGDFTRPVTTDWSKSVSDPLLREDLERCFAGDPQERFAGAVELAKNLRHLDQRRAALRRQQAELAARERAAYRRGVIRTAAVGTMVVAVVVGLALAAMGTSRVLRRHLYVSDMGLAWQALQDQQDGRARDLVERYLHRQAWEEELRGFEWRLLWQRSLTNYDSSFNEHRDRAKCAVFSPDGTRLATASDDKTVMVWDLSTKKRLKTLGGFDDFIDFKALAFSPDGSLLAAKGGKQLRVWRTDTWQEIATLPDVEPNDNGNNAVVFSPDGSTLATRAPKDGKNGVSFWTTATWQRTALFLPDTKLRRGGNYSVIGTVMAYSRDGRFFAVSDWEEVQIRDARQPVHLVTNLTRVPADEGPRVYSVAFSDKYVAAGYRDGIVVLWQRGNWEQKALEKVNQTFLTALAFSPDGSLLAFGSSQVVQVWDVETLVGASSRHEVIRPRITLRGHTRGIAAVAFSPDGRTLASASGDGTVKLWKLDQDPDEPKLAGSTDPVGFSSDGKVFAVFHTDGRLHLWDVQARRDRGPVNVAVRTNNPAAVALAPNGQQLALGLTNGNVQLWRLSAPPALSQTLIGDGNPIVTLGYSPEPQAQRLVVLNRTGNEYRYRLHNLRGNVPPRFLSAVSGRTLWSDEQTFAFSPDGKLLAVVDNGRGLTLFNVNDGESRRIGADSELFRCVAFSPDGSMLAAGHDTRAMVWTWDAKSGRLRWTIATSSGFLAGLAFSPDGKTLLTWDADNVTRFWNVALRKEIMTIPNFRQGWGHTGFSPSGNALTLLSSRHSENLGRVELYTVPTPAEIDAAEKAKARAE